jgi:L-threonylcarbamoyladenylate synthase
MSPVAPWAFVMTLAEADGRLAEAVAALRAGELVIYPTETFYGIAADPESPRAIAKIFEAKGRAENQPIALIAADSASAFGLARDIPALALRLAQLFWPGPLTLVLPARDGLHPAVLGPDGVGVRVSSHLLARQLAAMFGRPITATSANLSGQPAIVSPDEVRASLGDRVKVLLEDGVLAGGVPSTVVAVISDGYQIIRQGAVAADKIAAAVARKEIA